MDAELVRWALTGLMGVILWFGKRMVNTNEQDITSLKKDVEDVRRSYMHKDDFKDFKVELKEMFLEFKQDIKDSLNHGKQ